MHDKARQGTDSAKQMVRYVLVGILSNICGYLVYLLVTAMGIGPKTTMTVLYISGAGIGYFGHRRWSFSHKGAVSTSLLRYGLAHSVGYALNLTLLIVFVDRLGFPHQIVQGIAICIIAGFLFLTFRFFVFPQQQPASQRITQ